MEVICFETLGGGGFKANYVNTNTGEEYRISGCKKDGGDTLYGGLIEIDDDGLPRGSTGRKYGQLPECKQQRTIRCSGKYQDAKGTTDDHFTPQFSWSSRDGRHGAVDRRGRAGEGGRSGEAAQGRGDLHGVHPSLARPRHSRKFSCSRICSTASEPSRASRSSRSTPINRRPATWRRTSQGSSRFPIFKTIDEALCLGGNELAVDAVLSIGEHGNYPTNKLGQLEYPRKRFFDEVVAVMERSKRFVPLFNDKHLSYRWEWAKRMYDTARRLGIPLMAGSSVPLAQRIPPLELPADAKIVEAVSIHGGGVESYDFHGLEVLQSMVEARRGGETGVTRVEFLSGEALWKAADDGRWSEDLAEAALAAEVGEKVSVARLRQEKRRQGPRHSAHLQRRPPRDRAQGRRKRHPLEFRLPARRRNRTARDAVLRRPVEQPQPVQGALARDPAALLQHRESPYPVERTLLATGILDAAMHSRHENRPARHAAPGLRLQAARLPRHARNGGESWKIITEGTAEPTGITPHGLG